MAYLFNLREVALTRNMDGPTDRVISIYRSKKLCLQGVYKWLTNVGTYVSQCENSIHVRILFFLFTVFLIDKNVNT